MLNQVSSDVGRTGLLLHLVPASLAQAGQLQFLHLDSCLQPYLACRCSSLFIISKVLWSMSAQGSLIVIVYFRFCNP